MLLVTANSKSRQYFAFFISIALLILPNIVFYFKKTLTISDIAYLILFILIVLSIFQRISYGFLILTPFIILSPLESLYIFNYEQPSSSHVIALFDETNIEEISGFLNATTLWILLILMGTGMIVILSIKQITCWQWDKKIRRWVLLAGLITVCLSLTEEFYFSDSQEDNHYNGLVAHQLDSINAARFMHLYPLGLPFRIIDFIQQRHGIAQANTMIKNFKFNSEQKPFTNERQIYVLVIGETARPDRWQLNGYQRPTNPLLTQLPNIISFTNMISAWAWTRMAVPVIVTRKPARNTNAFFAEKSIVSAFKEAGFKTYWLSMQGLLGVHESAIALHAHEADETYFLNPVDYKGAGGYDGKLLEEFSKLLHK
ncbi:MAG: sulfatase-like hydrolase/transferase, partial [Gammaproteobacteria bacterium]